jgi:hypothetical protein
MNHDTFLSLIHPDDKTRLNKYIDKFEYSVLEGSQIVYDQVYRAPDADFGPQSKRRENTSRLPSLGNLFKSLEGKRTLEEIAAEEAERRAAEEAKRKE